MYLFTYFRFKYILEKTVPLKSEEPPIYSREFTAVKGIDIQLPCLQQLVAASYSKPDRSNSLS